MTVMFFESDCGRTQGMPVPTDFPVPVTTGPEISEQFSAALEIDYFTQARKALSERCPFEDKDENWSLTKATLPSGLAALLNQGYDNRKKRRKKSHSGAEKKKLTGGCGSNIWIETEGYFRDLTLADIDTLLELSSSRCSLVDSECFSIPVITENDPRVNVVVSSENEKGNGQNADSVVVKNENGFFGVGSVNDKVDSVSDKIGRVSDKVNSVNDKDHATYDSSGCAVSLEWLLGCRNKVSLTSERPSKKRKLLGGDAGLEKFLFTIPTDGNLSYCHYCGWGDLGLASNRLLVCGSCKVAVHRKCYGVLVDVHCESWFCSWCEKKDEVSGMVNPCVLCPNKGGALKPVSRSGEGVERIQFAHLFCCLWTPEVYVDDLKKMEPIANVDEIEESRRKLVCNVCKVKSGACVRCSNGSCRISFHPLCARESRQQMEVWVKDCSDNVELRAFCFKHSDLQENSSILHSGDSVAVGTEFFDANGLQVRLPVNNENNLKSGHRNRDNIGIISDVGPYKLSHNEPEDGGLSNSRLSSHNISGCDADQQLYNIEMVGRSDENANASDTLKYALVWKKLLEKGKIDVKDVALQIGISPEALTPNIYEACMSPDVRLKIVNWLKAHVYASAMHKGLKVKFKSINSSKEDGATDDSDAPLMSDPGFLDLASFKSVPRRRVTVSNIRILKDNEMICSSEAVSSENGMPLDKLIVGEPNCENPGTFNEASIPEVTENNLTMSGDTLPEIHGKAHKTDKNSLTECMSDEKLTLCLMRASVLSKQHLPVCYNSEVPDSGSTRIDAISSYIHPYISKEVLQVHNRVLSKDIICPRGEGNCSLVESLRASGHSTKQYQHLTCLDDCKSDQVNIKQLVRSKEMGVLENSPEDEVEGELIYFQHRLLQNAARRRQIADNLIFSVTKSLPREIDTAHQQRWDAVLVNQYMFDLREAKKRGRKERKHKEAQAVLAAATAAAASPRVSSLRKDSLSEFVQQESLIKLDTLSRRDDVCSQHLPHVKDTFSRLAVTRTSSEKYSDFGLTSSNLSIEHPRLCDICRRPETLSRPILVCSGCKVAVHLDCYSGVKETTCSWYCELCEDLSSRTSGASAINSAEKPYFIAECALCGGTDGAFRKSSDGQWVHAFCAEWVFESTFKRGQAHAVDGMEAVLKGVDICCICRHKHGVCIKCNFGNCQTKFHPSCARRAGLYMNLSSAPSKPHHKPQHKAYCERHGSEQRAKAEAQKHGIEELRNLRQIRVELERLRLLCERIVRREKIKRELVLCSQDMLVCKRDHVARSVLAQSSFILPGRSSESTTTSLKVTTEGNRLCSEVVQRSDDVTVDSSVSDEHHRLSVSMDTDPKLDDVCSTSHSRYNHKIAESVQYSGKQIPHRASAASHNLDDGGWRSKSRKLQHAETFGKELIMTTDEASMKNSMLPKGYAYVPADCLSNDDMQSNQDVDANGSVEHDG